MLSHAGLWSLLWGGVIVELADGYRCITLVPPGCGLSERVPAREQNLDTAANAVGPLIDEIDLPPRRTWLVPGLTSALRSA